ncbi:MAG: hypothetical protein JWM16_12 [Verrucomicrobiales bacterium]|nr:hypothetical protein [Verrucomicrobiales bacterium]
MDQLKKLIQICKLHYEKIILSVVLLVLALAVFILWSAKNAEAEKNQKVVVEVGKKKVAGISSVDLSAFNKVLESAANPPALNFGLPHNLFNPVKWQRQPNGDLLKIQTGKEVGPDRMSATKITPLKLVIALDRVASPGSYYFGVTREAAEKPVERRKRQYFAKLDEKTPAFILKEIKGDLENPTELVLELVENGEKVVVTKDKPYERVDGYEADLLYTIENKPFNNVRVGSKITFAGETYNIVAINPNEVVMSAQINDKKHTVRLAAGQ